MPAPAPKPVPVMASPRKLPPETLSRSVIEIVSMVVLLVRAGWWRLASPDGALQRTDQNHHKWRPTVTACHPRFGATGRLVRQLRLPASLDAVPGPRGEHDHLDHQDQRDIDRRTCD